MQVVNFKQLVIDFVNVCRRRPGFASDPRQLDAFENAALTAIYGAHGALGTPVATQTWEARTLLLGAQQVSERIQIKIPWRCMIVGCLPIVESLPVIEDEFATPSTSSVDVRVSLLSQEEMSIASGTTRPVVAGQIQKDGVFVDLASFGVNGGGRVFPWVLPPNIAELGVEFRWKRGSAANPNPYQSAHIGLAFFARPLRLR